jgi:DNA-directed RNA polymerase specialized sigma24 family protein
MSDTQRSSGSDRRSLNGVAPWHRSRKETLPGTAHGDPEPAACRGLARLYTDHYGSLVRLAALLTGDAGCADDVAVDSFVALCSAGLVDAGDRAVSYLRRQVLLRSRLAARGYRTRGCAEPDAAGAEPCRGGCPGLPGCQSAACRFGSLPVVLALLTLRPAEREALVLTRYLDLPERQAAAVAGVSQTALRRDLAIAIEVLRARLPGDQPPCDGTPGR